MVPLVEFTTATPLNGPLAGRTTGTVQSGRHLGEPLFSGRVEAIIPMDAHSGRDLGFRAQAHLYLPAIFPDWYGKPISVTEPTSREAKPDGMRAATRYPSLAC